MKIDKELLKKQLSDLNIVLSNLRTGTGQVYNDHITSLEGIRSLCNEILLGKEVN